MKNFFIALLALTCLNVYGQKEPYVYITKEPILVYEYDLVEGVSNKDCVKVATPNQKFRQVGDVRSDKFLGQVYVIQFILKDSAANEPSYIKNSKNVINSEVDIDFFCIKASDYKEPAIIKRYAVWDQNSKVNVGTLIVPIKMRPKEDDIPFDFTTDFTLGSSFGFSFRMSHYQPNYLSAVAVFGVTSVGVDSLTTKGFINEPNTKLSAITPGFGIITEFNGFQIGFIIGWDIVGGTTGKKWVYNGRPWYSFGIGYQFLRKNDGD